MLKVKCRELPINRNGFTSAVMPVVAVYWKDPTIESGWVKDNHEEGLPDFVSYGVLVSQEGDLVVLAGTVAPDSTEEHYADRTKFPKGCIVKIDVIGEIVIK